MAEHPLSAVGDDDASVRGALQRLSHLEGCRTVVCAAAADLWHAGPLQDSACLIVDVRMPRMSGLERQQQLATTHGPTPRICITAHDDAAARAGVAPWGHRLCVHTLPRGGLV
jgi:FixJ family two-component response regulator